VKNSIPVAASALAASALIALVLSGCSAGSLPGTSGAGSSSGTGSSGGSQGGSSSSRTFSADNLATILNTAKATLKADGSVENNAKLVADLKADGGAPTSVSSSLEAGGGKIEPTACAAIMDKTVALGGDGFGLGPKGVAAELIYKQGILAVITVDGSTLPSGEENRLLSTTSAMFSTCSTMKIVGGPAALTMTISKIGVHTDADQTYAYSEAIEGTGSVKKVAYPVIEAVYGNLVILDTALGGTQQDAVNAVNAVVAAAKG
jgi:hypothetical protein